MVFQVQKLMINCPSNPPKKTKKKKKYGDSNMWPHPHWYQLLRWKWMDEESFQSGLFDCFQSKEMWALIFSTRLLDVLSPLFISIVEFFPLMSFVRHCFRHDNAALRRTLLFCCRVFKLLVLSMPLWIIKIVSV
jgi:hypothetical protein